MKTTILDKADLSKIKNLEFGGIDSTDYPDFCDAHIVAATWDDGRDLTEAELDTLNWDHSDFVYEKLMKHLY